MTSNVVKLPTAAPRQVKQPQNKAGCAARNALRKAQNREFPFRFPSLRHADVIAAAIHPMTIDRWLLVSILNVLDDDQLAKISKGAEYSPTVAGLVRMARANTGLMLDVTRSLRELEN